MTNLVAHLHHSWLFSVPDGPRRFWAVILWWEARRIVYNLIVGSVGIVSLTTMLVVSTLPPSLPPEQTDFEYLFAPVAFGFLANVFYTGGWMCEIVIRWMDQGASRRFGPSAFGLGVLLSALLALTPATFSLFGWEYRLASSLIP